MDAIEGHAVAGTQRDEAIDAASVDADRNAVRHIQHHAIVGHVQLAVLRQHAGTIEHDVGFGVGADPVDAQAQQDLRMIAIGKYEFHADSGPLHLPSAEACEFALVPPQ
jgi:hypothetical protein